MKFAAFLKQILMKNLFSNFDPTRCLKINTNDWTNKYTNVFAHMKKIIELIKQWSHFDVYKKENFIYKIKFNKEYSFLKQNVNDLLPIFRPK